MARKLRSLTRNIVPLPGSGERPVGREVLPSSGIEPGAVVESTPPVGGVGSAEPKDGGRDAVARLAYQRWLETGNGEVENWVWAENELRRRSDESGGAC